MNTLGFAVFVVVVAAANAGLLAGHLGYAATPLDTAAVIAGPSGKIVRSGLAYGHAAPLAYAHAAPLAYAAPLAVAHSAAVVPHSVAQLGLKLSAPAGSGLEGQWIPDINEKFYDDGGYKPYVYGL